MCMKVANSGVKFPDLDSPHIFNLIIYMSRSISLMGSRVSDVDSSLSGCFMYAINSHLIESKASDIGRSLS